MVSGCVYINILCENNGICFIFIFFHANFQGQSNIKEKKYLSNTLKKTIVCHPK